MAEFDPKRIVLELLDHGVDFVLIGANAAILQGVGLPTTLDVDVTFATSKANLKRLAETLGVAAGPTSSPTRRRAGRRAARCQDAEQYVGHHDQHALRTA